MVTEHQPGIKAVVWVLLSSRQLHVNPQHFKVLIFSFGHGPATTLSRSSVRKPVCSTVLPPFKVAPVAWQRVRVLTAGHSEPKPTDFTQGNDYGSHIFQAERKHGFSNQNVF